MKAWELIKALEEGEKLQYIGWNSCLYISRDSWNTINPPSYYVEGIYQQPEQWKIYTEPRWEDNIPECGVLCWTWNDPGFEVVNIITMVDKGSDFPYYGYAYARPMTKSEIQQWIDNAPEE